MKIHNKGFLVFLALVIVFSVGFPILNKYYLQPAQFKSELTKMLIEARSFDATDEQYEQYSNCLYNYLLKEYHSVDRFPQWKDYNQSEQDVCMTCIINNLLPDSLDKQAMILSLDSIKSRVWKKKI